MKQGFMGDQPGGHGGADDLSGAGLTPGTPWKTGRAEGADKRFAEQNLGAGPIYLARVIKERGPMKQGFMGDQPGGHGGADDLSGAGLTPGTPWKTERAEGADKLKKRG